VFGKSKTCRASAWPSHLLSSASIESVAYLRVCRVHNELPAVWLGHTDARQVFDLPAAESFFSAGLGPAVRCQARLAEVHDPSLQGAGGGLGAVGDTQFAENVIDVTLDGCFANRKLAGDLFVALAVDNLLEHFELTTG